MLDVLNTELLAMEEQQKLLRYIDQRLEQIELLLYRMEALAKQAATDIPDAERISIQKRIEQLKEEMDRISAELQAPDM